MKNFPRIEFAGTLRPSQAEVVKIAREQFEDGQSKLHIVAPPGSGKTILGLYLWAECVKRPALVLSPNSAIQSQWTARTDLFNLPQPDSLGDFNVTSSDGQRPALLTSLTYQSVTMPDAADPRTDQAAISMWQQALVESEHAQDITEAEVWIRDLEKRNIDYYEKRLSAYRKKVRDEIALSGEALSLLHPNCLSTLRALREAECGLLILDECHHLMGHWGRVLAEAHTMLGSPTVIGLTATPPDRSGKKSEDTERYDKFFGPIDFEVPVPAVVKDGYLAPYQDLAWFVRPTDAELEFVANVDNDLVELVETLCVHADKSSTQFSAEKPSDSRDRSTAENGSDSLGSGSKLTNRANPNEVADLRSGDDAVEAEANPEELVDPEPDLEDRDHLHLGADQIVDEESAGEADDTQSEAETNEHTCEESLPNWLHRVLSERRLSTGVVKDWRGFYRRDPAFADAARAFLYSRNLPLPKNVPPLHGLSRAATSDPPTTTDRRETERLGMEVLVPVLDRYIRHRLRRSEDARDHELAQRAIRRLRLLGIQITETGSRACASPVGRVLAYSTAKSLALTSILHAEMDALGERIRAVVIADFEKKSAVSAEIKHLLDGESGGAVAAFKTLVNDPRTDELDAILLTGSSVLVDDDIADKFLSAARAWLKEKGFKIELTDDAHDSFHVINGRGNNWSPRVYVEMITELYQRGLTRCLVGTRGLLGEGWDANKINVLVDLTTATTSMTVNQLRGRSIRLDPDDKHKLANNWDVVCIAPEFTKGLDDYKRFEAKHHWLYGVTDDGAIEKGVGHVHAAFTEIRPEGIEESTQALNADMLERVFQRTHFRSLWKIGQPYRSEPIRAVEVKIKPTSANQFPPFTDASEAWSGESLTAAIATAILYALDELLLVERRYEIQTGRRAGDYVRTFLSNASEEESKLFGVALAEALGPLGNPRYVIERMVESREETLLSRLSPRIVKKYFVKRKQRRAMLHAVPTILSRNKELVSVYKRYWNRLVSPGEAIFVMHQSGAGVLNEAQFKGEVPNFNVRQKDIFG